jgi:hypothetical protein
MKTYSGKYEVSDTRTEQDRVSHNVEDGDTYTPKLLWDLSSVKTIFS